MANIEGWAQDRGYDISRTLLIQGGKIVLGIYLGAQLIADALGGKVKKNSHKEIGWHTVSLTHEASRSKFFKVLPKKLHRRPVAW
jgi:GMP synthase-like glutamine amidotransferase